MLQPDLVLQRSINAALSGVAGIPPESNITLLPAAVVTAAYLNDALVAVQTAIGSGFRFVATKNGTEFLRLRFPANLILSGVELSVPTEHVTELILDTVLNGVLVCRLESADGVRKIAGTLGKSAADFIFTSDVVAASSIDVSVIKIRFSPDLGQGSGAVIPPTLVPLVPGGHLLTAPTYARLYGPGVQFIDSLANLVIGNTATENRQYSRFRSPFSGPLTSIQTYWAVGAGYSGGTGGTIVASVFRDDGTATHKPNTAAAALATGSLTGQLSGGAFTGAHTFSEAIPMTSTTDLQAGQIYHIEYKNTTAAPATNFISVNNYVASIGNGDAARWLSPVDWAVQQAYRTIGSGAAFTIDDYTVNVNPSATTIKYRPLMLLTVGGQKFGNVELETGNVLGNNPAGHPFIWTVATASPVRERFTPTSAENIAGFSVMTAASVGGSLNWELANGATVLKSGTISQAAANYSTAVGYGGLYAWYDIAFDASVGLAIGQTYDLKFTPVGAAIWKFSDEYPGDYAYTGAWALSQAQSFETGGWLNANHRNHTITSDQRSNWRVVLHKSGAAITKTNGVWIQQPTAITASVLAELASKNIFNIYWECGWPKGSDIGIANSLIPHSMRGILVTPSSVASLNSLIAATDPRFRLWAWFGTFSDDLSGPGSVDTNGHTNAKVDLTSPATRAAAINRMVQVANYGFYGIADDTEDFQSNSQPNNGASQNQVFIAYYNEFALASQAAGKPFIAYIPANWYAFADNELRKIDKPDYLFCVAPDVNAYNGAGGNPSWDLAVGKFFAGAVRPIIFNPTGQGPAVLNAQLNKLESLPFSSVAAQIVGYGLYLFPQIRNEGPWSRWDSWRAAHP